MRRNKGMTLVELMISILISLILGGVVVLFLHFGLEMERFNTINALNQQSLRAPFLELTPLIERATALEILTALPSSDDLDWGEVVLHIADPANPSQVLPGGANNLYFRTRSGDRIVSGFSHIASIDFSWTSVFDDEKLVRVTLTAENAGTELVYSTDVYPQNRFFRSHSSSIRKIGERPKTEIPLDGPDSGAYLKISSKIRTDLHVFVTTTSQDKPPFSLLLMEGKDSPASRDALPVGANVVGLFYVLTGSLSPRFECEWRLYGTLDEAQKMENYQVIGKDFLDGVAYYKERYEDRFKKVHAYCSSDDHGFGANNELSAVATGLDERYGKLYGGKDRLHSAVVNMHVGTTMASNPPEPFSISEYKKNAPDTFNKADVLKLDDSMEGKFLVLAVRLEGAGAWTQSKALRITPDTGTAAD